MQKRRILTLNTLFQKNSSVLSMREGIFSFCQVNQNCSYLTNLTVLGSTLQLPDLAYKQRAAENYTLLDDINSSKCPPVMLHPIRKKEELAVIMSILSPTAPSEDRVIQCQLLAGGVLRDIVHLIKGGVTPSKPSRTPGFGTQEEAVLLIYYELIKANEGITDPFALVGIPTEDILFRMHGLQLGTRKDLRTWLDKELLIELETNGRSDLTLLTIRWAIYLLPAAILS